MTDSLSEQRAELLQAVLRHIPFDGWSQRALNAAAGDLGLSAAEAINLYPNGTGELIEAFSTWADRQMLAELEQMDLGAMKVRERIATAVRIRIEVLAPHREAVRRGLSFLAMPQNGALGMKCLYRTVDSIWYAAGDRSTDYNFYSKRLLLAGVYSSTTLGWLNDKSEGFEATWRFLDRRISEVLKIGGSVGKSLGRLLDLPDRIMARRTAGPRRRNFGRPG